MIKEILVNLISNMQWKKYKNYKNLFSLLGLKNNLNVMIFLENIKKFKFMKKKFCPSQPRTCEKTASSYEKNKHYKFLKSSEERKKLLIKLFKDKESYLKLN